MDPLSVTASVIAVLQAANTIVSVCCDFRAAINTQPWALSRIISSINELRLILSRLEQIANESELNFDETDCSRLTALEVLCQEGGAAHNCLEELKTLEKKLVPGGWAGKDGSKRRAVIQSIGWQLKGKEAEEMLQRLERCKSTLNLALTMDQAATIRNLNKTLTNVDENTRSLFKQFQDISLEDRKRSILDWLSPIDPSLHHKEALMVRQAGTNDWFLSCKEFEHWIGIEKSFLWLSGFPGSGKTILMSTLIDYLQQHTHEKVPTLLAYFYCDFRSPETSDPLNIAGSLLAQICFKLGSFPASLEAAFNRCNLSQSFYGKRINMSTITDVFVEIASQHQVTILVDGLDECQKRQDILVFLRQLGTQGKFFKILVSSRDEADIRGALSDLPRMRLEASSACLDRDIDNYISHRLDNDREFKWLKPSFQQAIRERLGTKAKGMFRWAQCQLDSILKLKTMKDIRQALNCLPRSLQETYEKILEKVDAGCVDVVRKTLQWLVCDVSTFTLAELHESLAIEQGMDHIDEDAQLSSPMDIYDMCGSLIAFTAEGEVILAHLSVKDYLLSDSIKHGKASAFSLSAPKANAENAFRCLTYLSFAAFRTGPSQSADDFEVRLLNHPFLEHASTYWPSYAENAGSSCDELKARVLEFFTSPCRPQFMSWLQVICSEVVLRLQDLKRTAIERRKRGYNYYPKHATPLYYAASFGIEHVVKALLEQGAEVDATGGRLGATAFHAAALRGHVKVMDILFQNGADPNKLDFIKKTPLNSAALTGNVEVIKYLLEHGADPDILDDRNKTGYDWACMLGHEEAMKVLEPVMVGESSDSSDGDRAKRPKPLFTRNTASTAWVTTGDALLPGQSGSSSLQGSKPGTVEVTKTWSSSARRDSDVQ